MDAGRWVAASVVLAALLPVSCAREPATNRDAAGTVDATPDAGDVTAVDMPVEVPSPDGSTASCGGIIPAQCISDCGDEGALTIDPECVSGAWFCPRDYVWQPACAPDACAVALSQCCDATTGLLTDNPCRPDGTRAACPAGTRPGYESFCIPDSAPQGCKLLDGQPCDGTVEQCRDVEDSEIHCTCVTGTSAQGTWQCQPFIGP